MQSELFRTCDVIVAGAGPSGISAAISAARQGAKVLLVERFGRLGGAGVTSLVNPLMGDVTSEMTNEICKRFKHLGEDWELLDLVHADMLEEAGVEILLHCWVVGPLMNGKQVEGIRVLCKQGLLDLKASVVVDATADGDVAFGAGAAFEKGREGDGLLQPMTIMFRIGLVDKKVGILCGSEEQAHDCFVPGGSWHEVVTRGCETGELPKNVGIIRIYETSRPGERVINATQINYVDGTNIVDLTRAELEGRRQAVKVRDFLRKHAPGYENCTIAQMPSSVGVRETRRFLGVEYLTREDVCAGRKWETAIVKNASFVIDIHNPTGGGQAEGFAAKVQPYDIPYGCLVPREVDGLLLSGRCISGSHEAHASYRVQRIMMAVGSASGAAAAIAAREKIQPRAVEVAQVQKALGIS